MIQHRDTGDESEAAMTDEREDELNALRMTVDEGNEILSEYARAFAGLADEELRPCVDPCAGHLGPKANELFRKGLARYEEMYGAKP